MRKKFEENLFKSHLTKNKFLNSYSNSKKDILQTYSILSDSNYSISDINKNKSQLKLPNLTLKKKIKNTLNYNSSSFQTMKNSNLVNNDVFTFYPKKTFPKKIFKPKLLKETLKEKEEKFKSLSEKKNKSIQLITKTFSFRKKSLKRNNSKCINNINLEEEKDEINNYDIKDYYLNKKISDVLKKDFNGSCEKEEIIFYKSFLNKINFIEDIAIFPHFENTLMWKTKIFDDKTIRNKELCNLNLLNKNISISLNKKRGKILFQNNDIIPKKKIQNKNQILKNLKRKYEIIDFFEQKYERKKITFANNKDKNYCLNQFYNDKLI